MFKNYILVFVVVLAVCWGMQTAAETETPPFGQPESFRRQSTAGLLDDDLDIWLNNPSGLLPNPTGLTYIEGTRVYTNLSNFVSSEETQFSDNKSEDAFLIGSSGHFIFGSGGALYNYFQREELLRNQLDEMGESEYVTTTRFDNDGNGTYDRQEIDEANANNRQESSYHEFHFGYANAFGFTRWGLFYKFLTDSREHPTTFYQKITATDLIHDRLSLLNEMDEEGKTESSIDEHLFVASFMREQSASLRWGMQFGLNLRSEERTNHRRLTTMINNSPADTSLMDQISSNDIQDDNLPLSSMDFIVGVNGQYQWGENNTTWVDVVWKHQTGEVDNDAIQDAMFDSDEQITFGSMIQRQEIHNQNQSTIEGDLSGDELTIFTRTCYNFLSDRAKFAYGLGFITRKTTFEQTYNRQINNTEIFDDGDMEADDADDYTRTLTANEQEEEKITTAETIINVPVAMEFALTKKLDLRIGAIHTITYLDETTTNHIRLKDTPVQITEYGDGRVVGETDHVYTIENGDSQTIETTNTDTDYTYGAAYRVNDHFQIDLMGFTHLTDLSEWKLSATIKF